MQDVGLYLYGFLPGGTELDLAGLEGVEPLREIRTVDLGGISVVMSEVSLEAFEAAMASDLEGGPDPSWILPRALKHEAVLDTVLARSPVLPARFGTLFSSPEALAELAGAHRRKIAGFFESLGDRLEWSLRGYHDPSRSIDVLLESDPLLSSRRAALPASPGARYFQEKKLREDARRLARSTASLIADEVRQALRTITSDAISLPFRAAEGPDREMVLHETFLLTTGQAAEALALIRSAAAERVAGLIALEPSGPWPPFHFSPELEGAST